MSAERIEDIIAEMDRLYDLNKYEPATIMLRLGGYSALRNRLRASLERERAATRKVAADLMWGSEEAAAMDFPDLSRQLGDFAAELRRIAEGKP